MCGIAGILAAPNVDVRKALAAMVACQTHRGPDDQGLEFVELGNANLGLGQRRLSIIDLSPMGHQPMIHPETGDILIYNGELYNFQDLRKELEALGSRFRGHSDTEVILHALTRWGPKVLERLNGMFSIAFFDKKNRTLTLARDPIGMKPLYIAQTEHHLAFASEVRGVLASGIVTPYIDLGAVSGLLAYGAVQEPLSFFKAIRSFPPGSSQVFSVEQSGKIRAGPVQRFWNFPKVQTGASEREIAEQIRATMDKAVEEHLISDVPVGVFLSSGLDSTIVAGLATKHSRNIRTLTVGFALDDPDRSESAAAEATARELGVQHTDIQISSIEAERLTVDWLNRLDQPSVDGLNTFVISKAVRGAGIIVALSGLGGDELFGGYPSFEQVPRFLRTLQRAQMIPASIRSMGARMAMCRQPRLVRDKAAEMCAIGPDVFRLYLHRRRLMADAALHELGLNASREGLDATYLTAETVRDATEDNSDPIAAISRLEARFYMRNMLLRDTDNNGMAHSLEIRPPFLDKRLMDLAFSIPGHMRLPSGRANKHLLRVAFADMLRDEIKTLPKKGFYLPIRRWMLGPLRDMCVDALGHVKSLEAFSPKAVDAVWDRFNSHPDSQIWSSAFMLVVLGAYLRQTRMRVPTTPLTQPVRIS